MQLKNDRVNVLLSFLKATLLLCFCALSSIQPADCKSSPHSKISSKVNLTGEYEFKLERNESSLYVKELSPGKIQFAVKSLWIGNASTGNVHTGQAAGTTEVSNNSASYKDKEGFTLKFAFTLSRCVVTCMECSGFGGINVDPDGTYKKINSKVPKAADLEVDN